MKTINFFPTFVLLLGALLLVPAVGAQAQLPDPGMTVDASNTALVVTDATASAILPELDGNAAAQTNFRFIANATWSTEEAVSAIRDQ